MMGFAIVLPGQEVTNGQWADRMEVFTHGRGQCPVLPDSCTLFLSPQLRCQSQNTAQIEIFGV
tara:strand:+ start:4019 stop:4207 length:189 start_codon:yes stop_codon:yes gene_type:complete